ncbi:MAG: GNAT family N-acetyltransferase [Alphaproteobacteria bacterium]
MPKHTATKDTPVTTLVFREVTAAVWSDFAKLFESRGGPKNCWCMVWRDMDKTKERPDKSARKAAMRKRIHAGEPVGILGYYQDVPVAWCSIAPRATYRAGLADRQESDDQQRVWSVVCFYIHHSLRGQGIFAQLVKAAENYARRHGATILEAYPVDKTSPSYRFGGFKPSFAKIGYNLIGRAGTRRYIMRKKFTSV